jgi:SPOR domain
MDESGRGPGSGGGGHGGGGEEALPWLEPVDDEDGAPVLSARKMLAAVAMVLLAAALVAGVMYRVGRSHLTGAGDGPPVLIAAPAGPYKVKPSDPGGLDVAGESGTSFATGAGQETDARIDLNAVAEEPIARPMPKPVEKPVAVAEVKPGEPAKPAAEAKPARPEVADLKPSGPAGSTVQLGAYVNQAQAEAAWISLSKRFPTVAAMGKIVVPYAAAGSRGFRLRASAGSAAAASQACQALKVAGENCFVVR